MIHWQKSTYSGGAAGNECVEMTCVHDKLLLRESDEPGRILSLSPVGLAALLGEIRANRA
ncbi:DUF397 domain-containing protein [Streptomyces sp. SD15]